ncbi:hypothetical protein [Fretibacter rubidus]|uniref:hypothetical protein n=1 Tax=Fretibacter rubidus TaxID=570162 RepID=UPI00352B654D
MARLIFIVVVIVPVFALLFNTQGQAIEYQSEVESSIFETRIGHIVSELQDCDTHALPIYFHDEYLSVHSVDLIRDLDEIAQVCDIAAVTVIVNDGVETALAQSRVNTTLQHLEARELDAPLYSRMTDLETPNDMARHGAILVKMSQ